MEVKGAEGQGFHLKAPLAQQTDLQAAEDQQAALQQANEFFSREMEDDRSSL
ncbi:hypothetical protein JOQ06_020858, partial [Pogonophryne albipinna]